MTRMLSCSVAQEPPFTIYTDKTKACQDYVWYSSENLNANTALQVCPGGVSTPVADTRLHMIMVAATKTRPAFNASQLWTPLAMALPRARGSVNDEHPPGHMPVADRRCHLYTSCGWGSQCVACLGLEPWRVPCSYRTRRT